MQNDSYVKIIWHFIWEADAFWFGLQSTDANGNANNLPKFAEFDILTCTNITHIII